MTDKKQTRATELRPYGITLAYLANLAGRKLGYVKLWSAGFEKSSYLDSVAAGLITKRQQEQKAGA